MYALMSAAAEIEAEMIDRKRQNNWQPPILGNTITAQIKAYFVWQRGISASRLMI